MNQIKRFGSERSHFVNMQLNGLREGAEPRCSDFPVGTCVRSLQTPPDMWVTPIPAQVTFGAEIRCGWLVREWMKCSADRCFIAGWATASPAIVPWPGWAVRGGRTSLKLTDGCSDIAQQTSNSCPNFVEDFAFKEWNLFHSILKESL